jgi:hypothetical protein
MPAKDRIKKSASSARCFPHSREESQLPILEGNMTTQRSLVVRTMLLSVALWLPSMAFAQPSGAVQWNVFGATGGWTGIGGTQIGVGIGGERLLFKGLGIGFDVEGFGMNRFSSNYGGMVFATNGSYHFKNVTSSGKLVPFGTGGFSAIGVCESECGGGSGFNLGGGVNYWFKPDRGLRVEFRDHVVYDYGAYHKLEVRFGFSF